MVNKDVVEDAPAFGLTMRFNINSTDETSFLEHLTTLTMQGSKQPGFLNAEVTPRNGGLCKGEACEWIVVHRFRSAEYANSWFSSNERIEILKQFPEDRFLHEEVAPHTVGGTVTASITSTLMPGMEKQYYDWLHKIQTVQSRFPGYEGTYLQPPTGDAHGEWLTLLRFSTPESFDNWFNSKERKELLEESKGVIAHESIRRLSTSFPGWLPSDPVTKEEPANYKGAMLVLLGIQPIVLLQIHYIAPRLTFIPAAFETLLLNAMGISLITWVCMPLFTKVFYKWLLPKGPDKTKVEIAGILLIFSLYIVITLALSNLP